MSILKKYIELGFSICPFDVAADKPMLSWEPLKTVPLTLEQAAKVFTKSDNCGVVAFCGDISGGLRCIDIELHSDLSGTLWQDLENRICACDLELWNAFVIEQTKRGGYHLFYKILGAGASNSTLARRLETNEETDKYNLTATKKAEYGTRKKLLIEELGEGHPVTLTPTKRYKQIRGTFDDLQFITKQQHELLLAICADFDQLPPEKTPEKKQPKLNFGTEKEGRKAWVEYNERHNILDVMLGLGWKRTRTIGGWKIHLSKPERSGKDVDASILIESNTVHFWAVNCGWECGKAFTPFDIYKTVECGGDTAAAALKLRGLGFGEPLTDLSNDHQSQLNEARFQQLQKAKAKKLELTDGSENEIEPLIESAKIVLPTVQEILQPFKFDFFAPIVKENTILNFYVNGYEYRIGGRGKIVVLTGKEKSGKTTLAAGIAASALANKNIINTQLQLKGKMFWFDTEQPFDDFQETQHTIFKTAGQYQNLENYGAYSLIGFSKPERLTVIDKMIEESENLDVVFIDGIRDLIGDYNDLKAVELLMDRLVHWTSSKNILLVLNLHLSKTSNQTRGFLGAELNNKAVAILESARDEDLGCFNVIGRSMRYKKFPNFQFYRDGNGCPCLEQSDDVDWNAMKKDYGFNQVPSSNSADYEDAPF